MKKLIEITDEDAQKVVDTIHLLTENTIIGRFGIFGLSFEDSFRKHGDAWIDFECASIDTVSDGYFSTFSKFRIKFHHSSVWFEELSMDGEPSSYNKNHFFGYLKLQELGYELPEKPQWT